LLLRKDIRELLASRAYWILLLIVGPLVGHGFVTAVNLYAEASGIAGGPAALAQGLTPLDGILVPTFGAYDLAATLLFPFVAIRMIAAEKESGAWKLMLQSPAGISEMLSSKALALMIGWAFAWLPGLLALILWKAYGGYIYAPETLNLLFGHLLRVSISAGVAVAAAAVMPGAANAAIVTLAFTLGTWALEFIAAGRGGLLQQLASFTPTAALRSFEQGQLRLSVVLVTCVLACAGFALAAIWMKFSLPLRQQVQRSLAIGAICAAIAIPAAKARAAWDFSEDRRNSFSQADEAALAHLREPLHITVNLAAEDPRLMDLERNILSKLRRILPKVEMDYASEGRSGLFDSSKHYGEIWYEYNGQKVMSRSTTEPIVLETLYKLANVNAPAAASDSQFSGHPLAAKPTGVALAFYFIWPISICFFWWFDSKGNR
jgi:ABC-type transport system involved in multi-copper enzyme maturation permease subunit